MSSIYSIEIHRELFVQFSYDPHKILTYKTTLVYY